MNIKEVLDNLGYNPKSSSNYWVCAAIYRNGDNKNALSINKENGSFRDFVTGDRGSWNKFLNLALNGDKELIKKYSKSEFEIRDIPPIHNLNLMQTKKYDKSLLNKLIPYYDFYTNKGISKETLKLFQVGLATAAKLKNRLVFPIFALDGSMIGFAGRLVMDHEYLPKWLIVGSKKNFTYPLHLSAKSIIEKREVILVESVGDTISLFDAGIENIACIFGTSLQKEMLKQLISLNVRKITIGLNNDLNRTKIVKGEKVKSNPGQEAAVILKKQLSNFFDNIEIIVPPNGKNDWGKCNREEIQKFFNE